MTWQILISINILLYGISVLLQKTILKAKYSDPWSYSIFFQFMVATLMYLFFRINGNKMTFPIPFYHINIILMTLFWGLFNIFSAKALEVTEASTYSVILSLRVLVTTLSAYFYLNEKLAFPELVGIFLTLSGVILVSINRGGIKLTKNIYYVIFASLFMGLALTNDRALLKILDVPSYSVIAYLFPALLISVLKPSAIPKIKIYFSYPRILQMLLLGVLWIGASLSFNFALKIAPSASQVISAGLSTTVVTVILSIIFLKERDNLVSKITGTIITFIGLLLVVR